MNLFGRMLGSLVHTLSFVYLYCSSRFPRLKASAICITKAMTLHRVASLNSGPTLFLLAATLP